MREQNNLSKLKVCNVFQFYKKKELFVYGHGSYRKKMCIQKSICALTRSINNKSRACTVSYSPLNFCARVESVDDILLIASRVTLSIVVFELWDILCSILLLQHDPADGTSQYRSFTSGNKKDEKKTH